MSSIESTIDGSEDFDTVARELRELRTRAGGPSYAEIGQRIALDRRRRGVPPSAALPARTTVYDAFRDGRSRINAALVREIVCALGATPAEADEWEARCGRAQKTTVDRTRQVTVPPAAVPPVALEEEQAEVERPAPLAPPSAPRATTPLAAAPIAAAATSAAAPVPAARVGVPRPLALALILAACVGLNLAGHSLVALLGLPLFLDMIGTAVAAIALGPWRGVLVAVASTAAAAAAADLTAVPFGLVNVAGALVWGYGVRRFGGGRSFARFFLLNAVAGVVCTIVAVPVLLLVFGGATGHASDAITENLLTMGEALAPSVFTANLLTSVTDKLLTGFVALAVVSTFGLAGANALDAILGRSAAFYSASQQGDARTDAALPV